MITFDEIKHYTERLREYELSTGQDRGGRYLLEILEKETRIENINKHLEEIKKIAYLFGDTPTTSILEGWMYFLEHGKEKESE